MRLPQARFIVILFLGFSSGLPLALTASTLTVRLAEAGIDKATIGLFAGVALAYAFKFTGAPLVDGLKLPLLTRRLGRRRAWIAAMQTALALALLTLAELNPHAMFSFALCTLGVAVLSALQDIAIDAYRVERLSAEDQGTGAAYAVLGYRLGMIASSAGALYLATFFGWRATYQIMAALMAASFLTTLFCREPATDAARRAFAHGPGVAAWFAASVAAPLKNFLSRPYWALPLLLVLTYKLSDAFIGIMANPFFLETGFTKTQIADIVKLYGIATSILAGFAGGWLVKRWGMFPSLALGSIICAGSCLLYIPLTHAGASIPLMASIVLLDSAGGGLGSVALVAYIGNLCDRRFTATQYALLSSLAVFARAFAGMPAGWAAARLGWPEFFLLSSLFCLPGLVLIALLWRRQKNNGEELLPVIEEGKPA